MKVGDILREFVREQGYDLYSHQYVSDNVVDLKFESPLSFKAVRLSGASDSRVNFYKWSGAVQPKNDFFWFDGPYSVGSLADPGFFPRLASFIEDFAGGTLDANLDWNHSKSGFYHGSDGISWIHEGDQGGFKVMHYGIAVL